MKIARKTSKISITNYQLVQTNDPDILEVRSDAGFLSSLCLPLFWISILFLLLALQSPMHWIPMGGLESILPLPLLLFISLVATITYALPAFGRSGIILDKHRMLLISWKGLIRPMLQSEQSLKNAEQVSLKTEIEIEKAGSLSGLYKVSLEGDDMKAVVIYASNDPLDTRQRAKDIARFLSLPLIDATSSVAVHYDLDKLDETFLERVQGGKEHIPPLSRPLERMKTFIRETDDALILDIPDESGAIFKSAISGIIVSCVLISMYFLQALPYSPEVVYPQAFRLGFWLLASSVPIVTVLSAYQSRLRKTIVTVTQTCISFEEHRRRKHTLKEIPLEELQELSIGKPKPWYYPPLLPRKAKFPGIQARSVTTSVRFGAGLPQEELAYLLVLLKRRLMDR